jgi:hypothetical protein
LLAEPANGFPFLSNFGGYYFNKPLSYNALINSEAYKTFPLPFCVIPTCYAMFAAVILLSPVTMMTLMPALRQF